MPDSRETETTMKYEKRGWFADLIIGFFMFLVYGLIFATTLWVSWNWHIYEVFDMPQITYRQAWFVVLYSKVAHDILNLKVHNE
jgi:hypothetical protein